MDITASDNQSSSSTSLTVSSADAVRLMQAHLTSVGLHETCRVLRQESGIGLAAPLHASWQEWAHQGQWSLILQSLATLDQTKYMSHDNNNYKELWAEVHEMAILEVAAAGDLEMAYALYRLSMAYLQDCAKVYDKQTDRRMSRARRLEIKLQDLAQLRSPSKQHQAKQSSSLLLPPDYYSNGNHGSQDHKEETTRDERRQDLGKRLAAAIPVQPPDRFMTLLQQAIKYQSYTGILPQVQQVWNEHDEDGDNNDNNYNDGEDDAKNRKQSKKKRKRKVFDLVLGTTLVDAAAAATSGASRRRHGTTETAISKPLATVKFGKRAVCEAAVFSPDGTSLVTGSSDGLVEVWSTLDFTLRTDLPYQQQQQQTSKDNYEDLPLIGHEEAVTALAISNDGTLLATGTVRGDISVWRLDSGKQLRTMKHGSSSSVSHLVFAPDASRLLSCGGTECREFGLRTAQRLREYSLGEIALLSCGYHYVEHNTTKEGLQVWTAAADGSVRFYSATTASPLWAWRPSTRNATVGSSILTDATSTADRIVSESPSIHTVLTVTTMTPPCFLLVPRANQAYLVNEEGTVLRIFRDNNHKTENDSVFCAAAMSPGQQWLYAVRDDGKCSVFDVSTGELERTMDHFGKETTQKTKGDGQVADSPIEISAMAPHPHKSLLACFSNDKRQKKGQLVVWK